MFTPVTEIPAGKGLLYVYRPSMFAGQGIVYTVGFDNEVYNEQRLVNGSYFVYFLDPGTYDIQGGTRSVLMNIEAGKTYYIRGTCCSFLQTTEDEAWDEIISCEKHGTKASEGKNKSKRTTAIILMVISGIAVAISVALGS